MNPITRSLLHGALAHHLASQRFHLATQACHFVLRSLIGWNSGTLGCAVTPSMRDPSHYGQRTHDHYGGNPDPELTAAAGSDDIRCH
jgi:hypothetical protein